MQNYRLTMKYIHNTSFITSYLIFGMLCTELARGIIRLHEDKNINSHLSESRKILFSNKYVAGTQNGNVTAQGSNNQRETFLSETFDRAANFIPNALHNFAKRLGVVSGRGLRTKRDISHYDLARTFRALINSKSNLNEDNRKTLKEIEEFYNKVLSGEVKGIPDLDDIERDKSKLVKIVKEVLNQRGVEKNLNIEHVLQNATEYTKERWTKTPNVTLPTSTSVPKFNMIPLLIRPTNVSSLNDKEINNNSTFEKLKQPIIETGTNVKLMNSKTDTDSKFMQPKAEPHSNVKVLRPKSETNSIVTRNQANQNGSELHHNIKRHNNSYTDDIFPSLLSVLESLESGEQNSSTKEDLDITKNGFNSTFSSRIGQVEQNTFNKVSSSLSLNQMNSQNTQSALQLLPGNLFNQGNYHTGMQSMSYPQTQQTGIQDQAAPTSILDIISTDDEALAALGDLLLSTQAVHNSGTQEKQEIAFSPSDLTVALENLLLPPQTTANPEIQENNFQPSDLTAIVNAIASLEPVQQTSQPADVLFVDSINLQDPQPSDNSPLSTLNTNNIISTNELLSTAGNTAVSPQLLANLLVKLQMPSVEEIANGISNTRIPDTRLSPELVTAFTTLLTSITDAITQFLMDLQMAIMDNPLLAVLLALAALALLWHKFPFTIKKKKKGGYGHDHHGGYHRRHYDIAEFRDLDSDAHSLAVNIVSQIATFEKWLNGFDDS